MLKKWLREPLLHFLLIGGLFFFLYGLQNGGVVGDSNNIVVTEPDIDRMIALWEKKWQRLPTQSELEGLIEQQIREEVLYREAIVMGLDQNDTIVRRRLAQKVEFISADIASQAEPSEGELQAYLDAHADKFEEPARITFQHIYLNADQRGENAKIDAKRLLTELSQPDLNIDIMTLGDPFMFGQQHQQLTEREVSRLFGAEFAAELFTLPVAGWQGPVASGYGLHLVRIEEMSVARQSELDAVREKVRNEVLSQRRREADKAFYEALRKRYVVTVESTSNESRKLTEQAVR